MFYGRRKTKRVLVKRAVLALCFVVGAFVVMLYMASPTTGRGAGGRSQLPLHSLVPRHDVSIEGGGGDDSRAHVVLDRVEDTHASGITRQQVDHHHLGQHGSHQQHDAHDRLGQALGHVDEDTSAPSALDVEHAREQAVADLHVNHVDTNVDRPNFKKFYASVKSEGALDRLRRKLDDDLIGGDSPPTEQPRSSGDDPLGGNSKDTPEPPAEEPDPGNDRDAPDPTHPDEAEDEVATDPNGDRDAPVHDENEARPELKLSGDVNNLHLDRSAINQHHNGVELKDFKVNAKPEIPQVPEDAPPDENADPDPLANDTDAPTDPPAPDDGSSYGARRAHPALHMDADHTNRDELAELQKEHHEVEFRGAAAGIPGKSRHRLKAQPEPWKLFDDIHVRPLDATSRLELEDDAVNMDEIPEELLDVPLDEMKGNPIAKQYADVNDLPPGDALHSRFKGQMWAQRPLLATVLKRWIVLNRDMRNGKRKPRVVTVNPVGQLCNRLMAITSAFMFALITGRSLHIEDGGFYCQMSDLFVDPGFEWVSPPSGMSSDSHHLQNPESGVWEDMEPLLCASYAKHYYKKNVVFSINQYLVPYFSTNPAYREALIELFTSEDLFTPASHFLFRPIDKLLKMRDEYMEKHFQQKYVVGLQVRSGGDFTDNFMTSHDWGLYKRCGESMTPSELGDDLVYFVATDTQKGRDAAKRELGESKVMFGPGEFLLSNNPTGVQMALLDLLLLAAADDRVATAWSSYGYFAAGYSGVAAGMVVDEVDKSKWIAPKGKEQRFMGVMHKSDTRRQCVRLPVHQPCFHKFESWGASKASCQKWEWFEREMLGGRYC